MTVSSKLSLATLAIRIPIYTCMGLSSWVITAGLITVPIVASRVYLCNKPFQANVALAACFLISLSWAATLSAKFAITGERNRLMLAYILSWQPLQIAIFVSEDPPSVQMKPLAGFKRWLKAEHQRRRWLLERNTDYTVLFLTHSTVEASLFTVLLKNSINAETFGLDYVIAAVTILVPIGCVVQCVILNLAEFRAAYKAGTNTPNTHQPGPVDDDLSEAHHDRSGPVDANPNEDHQDQTKRDSLWSEKGRTQGERAGQDC